MTLNEVLVQYKNDGVERMKHVNAALHVRDAYVTGEPGNPNTEGGPDVSPNTSIEIPIADVPAFYRSLPKGGLKHCYHCGHEGPLTGNPFPDLCVDRDACNDRITDDRRARGVKPYDVRLAKEMQCAEHGHSPTYEHHYCLGDLATAMENIGRNRFVWFTYCMVCSKILTEREVVA
jgi:hypothetical protein